MLFFRDSYRVRVDGAHNLTTAGICAGVCILAIVWFGLSASLVTAKSDGDITVLLRKSALQSGYTVRNMTGTVAIGIQPNSIQGAKKTRVRIRKRKSNTVPAHTATLISDVYVYKVDKGKGKQVNLVEPVWVTMSYVASASGQDKQLKYWNTKKKQWRKMSSSDRPDQLQVTGQLHRTSALVGVFTKPLDTAEGTVGGIVEGKASWYDGTGAASNDFLMGSRIRVTNTATDEYVDSTVVSTGPFVAGRVVDLNRSDFAAIADLSTGVINVTVQQVEE